MLTQVNNLDDRSAEAYWARRRDGASHTEAMTGLTQTRPVIKRTGKVVPREERPAPSKAVKKVAAPRQTAADRAQSAKIASAFHEDWRKTRLQKDGTYEPRIKKTQDEAWIVAHNTDEVDIANTPYADLPEDWKAENKAAAEVVQGILKRHGGSIDLNDEATRQSLVSWLTTELDRAATAKPNAGHPLLHRLNRVEYGNAVRDLLALEVDTATLLPPDDAAYGFDSSFAVGTATAFGSALYR